MDIELHPLFREWLLRLSNSKDLWDAFGDVLALISALEDRGRNLEGDASHPVVTSAYDLHALRRNPPTKFTPYAHDPPVFRVLYGYVRHVSGTEKAIVAIGGDKTELGNAWYPANIAQAESRIDEWCRNNPHYKPIATRGSPR